MEANRSPASSLDAVRERLQAQCVALSPALFGWAHLRLRGFPRQRVEAEDIVQETWFRALASVTADTARLAEPGGFRAWLFGIAQNVLLEELRRDRKPDRSQNTYSTALLGRQADTVTSVCTALSRQETVQSFLKFAAELDEPDRQLLVRCAFEDVTASDVGRRLGLEPSTAVKRWQRLRERLRATRLDERLGLVPVP
jgi:RNA polymerase sigma factor (sigma-70 family)